MFYVHVIGPYDNTFVGPFSTLTAANDYVATVHKKPNAYAFNAYVMTRQQFMANVNEFGIVQVQAVLQ